MEARQARLRAALGMAEEAGAILASYASGGELDIRAKGERDVVTAADVASEALILDSVRRAFPEDSIVAEEGGVVRDSGERRWYVDPLDGTLNFSRSIPIWCVSIALFESGAPTVGVVHDPLLHETYAACTGQGAHMNGTAIACSGVSDISRAVVHVTTDFEARGMQEGLQDLNALQQHVLRTRNLGSAALGLAYVGSGRLDAMVHRHAHTWDYGAGALLVREAGGCITEADGSPYSEASTSILAAATQGLHRALLDLLRAAVP
ncbi:MAG: inositol monophosphatase family protein [Chloroflexota bacterium]